MSKLLNYIDVYNLFMLILFFCHIFIMMCIFFLMLNRFYFFNTIFTKKYYFQMKYYFLFLVSFLSCLIFFLIHKAYMSLQLELQISQNYDLPTKFFFAEPTFFFTYEFRYFYSIFIMQFLLTKYSLLFLALFATLFPLIFCFFIFDSSSTNLNFYCWMIMIFMLCYLLVVTDSMMYFFIVYELLIMLLFLVLYLTSNSSGGIDALVSYLGWALIGSFSVAMGFFFLILLTNQYKFSTLDLAHLSSTDVYHMYMFFFFGFGMKLSVWPFWYWLPKAHVEVSTGMSIFLSCILMKIAYFCLLKIQLILPLEMNLNMFLMFCTFCIIDLVSKFMNLKDLKAIVAYSSVLHTNLLVLLNHIDTSKIITSSILYVWGHSLATACLFICVYLIEQRYHTSNILYISGLWQNFPEIGMLLLASMIFFLDFPLTLLYWGEMWLWLLLFNNFFSLASLIYMSSNMIFMSLSFKFWWGMLCGTASQQSKPKNLLFHYNIMMMTGWFIVIQIFTGIQPSLLTSLFSFIMN